jgi:hypothetical protein
VEIQVVEGSSVQVSTADGRGVDRRAFGEFVSHRGELASYALGWVTGPDPQVARMSIGIGAGNTGGATFHAVVFAHEDGHAFTLVDEPFENVPEGGPDLTAQQARAHDTLPFVWWVADTVMQQDRRARWMRHWLLGLVRCRLRRLRHDDLWRVVPVAVGQRGDRAVVGPRDVHTG